jgi:hypothetical protein
MSDLSKTNHPYYRNEEGSATNIHESPDRCGWSYSWHCNRDKACNPIWFVSKCTSSSSPCDYGDIDLGKRRNLVVLRKKAVVRLDLGWVACFRCFF